MGAGVEEVRALGLYMPALARVIMGWALRVPEAEVEEGDGMGEEVWLLDGEGVLEAEEEEEG